MSADNGIFIVRNPTGGFAVVHSTMSEMPDNLPRLLETKVGLCSDPIVFCDGIQKAYAAANKIRRSMEGQIIEYGIVDWSDTEWWAGIKIHADDLIYHCSHCPESIEIDGEMHCGHDLGKNDAIDAESEIPPWCPLKSYV